MEFGLWHGVLTVAIFILGGVIKLLYNLLRALDERDRTLAERVGLLEKHLEADFVTMSELNRKGDIWRSEIAILNTRLEEVRKGRRQ